MRKSQYTEEQIHGAVKQLEAGRTAQEVGREMGVSVGTLYNWKAKDGGLEIGEAKRLNELADENSRLKRLVADLSLDREALKWVIEKNGWSSQLSAKK
ncbi:MAG: transposase [Acidobacteria bacterium]|nr:transposase [Acidobacteriota bacterium]